MPRSKRGSTLGMAAVVVSAGIVPFRVLGLDRDLAIAGVILPAARPG